MQNPPLAYFVEENGQIYLCVKNDSIGYWRFPVSPEKALDLAAEVLRMARDALARRK